MSNRKTTKKIIVHHSVTDPNISQPALRSIFKSRFKVNYIGYNICVRPDGSVMSDIGDDGFGIHNATGSYTNANSVGVCVLGTFTDNLPPTKQLSGLRRELDRLKNKYGLKNEDVIGHRDTGKATACPGEKLYEWLNIYKQGEAMDCKEERVEAIADIYQAGWEVLNPNQVVNIDSIRKEAREADDKDRKKRAKLKFKDWLNTSLKARYFISRNDYSKRVGELKSEIEVQNNLNDRLGLKLAKLQGNFNMLTDRLANRLDELTITDHLRGIGRHILKFINGEK